MRLDKMIPTLLLTAVVAACGGAEDAAEREMDEEEEMAAAEATETDSGCYLQDATAEEAAERPSPLQTTEFSVGGTEGVICYGAPSARDRAVMGELVPYDEPWRTGANEATAIHLEGPAVIGGIELDEGSYSLYTLPNEDEWEIFLNSNFERWGIPISDEVREDEIGSFMVTPEETDGMVETLDFSFESTGDDAGELVMEWEDTRIRIPVEAGT